MKKILRSILYSLPAILCMILIFSFSAEPASESSQTSGGTIRFLLDSLYPGFDNITPEDQTALVESLQFVARKSAHFIIYAVLGFSVMTALIPYSLRTKFKYITAAFISFIYCLSDEIHQYFVPGRACQLRDVFIDSAGIASGIAMFWIITFIIRQIRKKD